MRKQLKIRLALFLTILMVLPSIVSILPMTATEVSAASNTIYLSWDGDFGYNNDDVIQVEKGQKFYVGDYAYIGIYGKSSSWYGTASMKNPSYSSSKKSVATVDKKGYFVAKGKGTTTITIKYNGKKITKKFKVVSTGDFGYEDQISGIKEKAEKLATKIPSKVTTKNGFSLFKDKTDYEEYLKKGDNALLTISTDGVISDYNRELVVPQAGRYNVVDKMLDEYASKNSPTSTRSAKVLKIKSASATTSQITVKLKKKVSAEQILAAKAGYDYGVCGAPQPKSSNKAYISVSIRDSKSKTWIYGRGELTKGSTVLKIKPYKLSMKSFNYSATKLKKGRTYCLEYKAAWTKGKTVKVK